MCEGQPERQGHLEPWASDTHPTDVPGRHVEEISTGRHEYTVTQGGTMDGQNCCSPMSVGMNMEGALEQTWESNRLVRMANVGETDVLNPWLSNGRNLFRTVDEIVNAAITPGMSDSEKAKAIWFQDCRYHYHFVADNAELSDPVRVFNVYGCYLCGANGTHLAGLWRHAGLKVSPSAGTIGHTTVRVFFDGRWHNLDGDQHALFLLRDNETVADDQDLVRDHDLIKRAHTMGILLGDYRRLDESFAAYFAHEGEVSGERNCRQGTTMNMTLRPGEALVWRWGHLSPPKLRGREKANYPNMICNGLWEYRPDFSQDLWRKGAVSVENVESGPDGLFAREGREGTIVWSVSSPYVLVGGSLETEADGAQFALSFGGESWQEVGGTSLDAFFPATGQSPRHSYLLRCRLSGAARLKRLAIINDLQMAPLVLPGMAVGENAFTYTDETDGARAVRITHEWVERSTSRPPQASSGPVFPADGGETDGTAIVFRWDEAEDADGDRIADYHFELSDRPDMLWPLSTNFYRLISRTKDKGKPQYTLPRAGLLTPDRKYYWHVRAEDGKGVWGPWSRTWSFTARGPAYPLDVTVGYDKDKRLGILRWRPNPVGRRPVGYRVYGSDEKGFSVSDEPYAVVVGASKELTSPFPANFIAETTATELAVLGMEVDLPAANKAYYRVVAVDAQGNRSGPSDYAAVQRPFIYTAPVVRARAGEEYRYQVCATRSLGDLRDRMVDGSPTASFWDVERPLYTLAEGPAWLRIDEATGLLSGTPDAAGTADVAVTVTIDQEVRELDLDLAGWGQERVTGTRVERVGSDTQRFTIEVGK
ncbi:MAG: hypothetical protein AMK73_01520 [Planctomycetes bacterium SM23_32]|nr:MAG: hypothetical protein AMK73_01520 [Planctomycetes bacterium SM23_32]